MPLYRLENGRHRCKKTRKHLAPGAVVELTESQYKAFRDKFKPAEVQTTEAKQPEKTKAPKPPEAPEVDTFDPAPFATGGGWYLFGDGHKAQLSKDEARQYLTDQGAEVVRSWLDGE